jgi:DNA-binding CsgD family transcriptional regulator
MSCEDIFDLIERFSKTERLAQGHVALRSALSDYGLEHVAYAAINLPIASHDRPLVAVTYAAEWQKHYLQEGYVNLDPIVQAGMGGILPVDWDSIDRSDPLILRFFGEAQEFKISAKGLSFPVRGRHGEFALFSVTSALPDAEWQKVKKNYMRDFMILAYYFHSWAMKAEGLEETEMGAKLSAREKDCLRWRAMGKSDWEISQILAISERTVKFHLECARSKLGASNTVHAVARAMTHGLVAF